MPLGVNFQWSSVCSTQWVWEESHRWESPAQHRSCPASSSFSPPLLCGGASGGSHTAEWSTQPGPGVRVCLASPVLSVPEDTHLKGARLDSFFTPSSWSEECDTDTKETHSAVSPSVQREDRICSKVLRYGVEIKANFASVSCDKGTICAEGVSYSTLFYCVLSSFIILSTCVLLYSILFYSNGIFLV